MLVLFIAGLLGDACSSRSALDPEPGGSAAAENTSSSGGVMPFEGTGGAAPATGGIGSGGATETAIPVDATAIEQDLMARWNQAAASVPNNMCCGLTFNWDVFDKFPHPTFKLGNDEAYQEFAQVLLAFYQSGDNFDFLARNGLFQLSLRYSFGNGGGESWTFEQLTSSYTGTRTIGNVPEATRAALAEYAARIQRVLSAASTGA